MGETATVASCTPYKTQRATHDENIATLIDTPMQQGSIKTLALKVLERNNQRNTSAASPRDNAQLSPVDERETVALVLSSVADEFSHSASEIIKWYRDDIDVLFDMQIDNIRLIVHDFITGGYK